MHLCSLKIGAILTAPKIPPLKTICSNFFSCHFEHRPQLREQAELHEHLDRMFFIEIESALFGI